MKSLNDSAGTIPTEERDLRVGFTLALVFHIALTLIVLVKGAFFPGKPIPYIPALRVDLVGLPDILKKDLHQIPHTVSPSNSEIEKALKKADQALKTKTPPKVEPKTEEDEVGLKPKADPTKDRQKKLKSSLDRIRSLERIKESVESSKPKPAVVVKGNQVSQGTSLSAEAKETAMSSYYDVLRDRLQENWALPVWLSRQNLAAQVLVYLDGRGYVRALKFTKSSGNAQFDEAVRGSVRAGEPFPPPPAGIAESIATNGVLVGFPL